MANWHFIISRLYVWLTRWNRCRGFGIQSPNDYAFVRNVINEHRPYYGYATMKRAYPSLDAMSRKKYQLFLRLANFQQPKTLVDWVGEDDCCHDYLKAGCAACRIETNVGADALSIADMVRCRIDDRRWVACLDEMKQGVLVIIEPSNARSIRMCDWQDLLDSLPYGECYNLYYCGIIILDKIRYKQNYIINF